MAVGFQCVELPPDEHVLEFISGGGDHGPAPVDILAEPGQVLLADGREELQPVVGIRELVDVSAGDAHLQQYALPLGFVDVGLLGDDKAAACLERHLLFQAVCGRVDGTARAVEAEGPQHVLALQPLEPRCKLIFRRTEPMPQVQLAVHIRVRKCHHLFRSVVWI